MENSSKRTVSDRPECWPMLPLDEWKDTYATLHMWMQIAGKVRMALSPPVNHWWNVPFYVSPRGLVSSPIPYGDRIFEIQFDFVDHNLLIQTNGGLSQTLPLIPRSVADFYKEFIQLLRTSGVEVKIWKMPVEIPHPIPFDQDKVHASYNAEQANRFWRTLVSIDQVLKEFRSGFIGKCSPVHFFWGSFDLCVTRFSGRPAPERTGADAMTREAYSHEVSSVGFWPGGGDVKIAVFYSYTAPEPKGFREHPVRPNAAYYQPQLGEFILTYDEVRRSSSPTTALLEFCQTTYEAGASLGKWDRIALERGPGSTAAKA